MAQAGVYKATKKDGTTYYRASITYHSKHISLGSYALESDANAAYTEADHVLRNHWLSIDVLPDIFERNAPMLSLEKLVILLNFRDHGIYFKTPIYIYPKHFHYYLSYDRILTFDRDDLFFYASHKIMTRKGRLFYCDYGNQYGILTRYGMKGYSVEGRDFQFVNGDTNDYRYANIQIINQYMGVQRFEAAGRFKYQSLIHVNGNYQIGIYDSEILAAIAYNKAADFLTQKGSPKKYIKNYILGLSSNEYMNLYQDVKISGNLARITF